MSEVKRASAEVRRRLLRQDRETLRIVAAAHRQAIAAVRGELTAVTGKIMAAAEQGVEANLAWLYQQSRYQQLLVQAEATYNQFARTAAQAITQAQYDVVAAAQADTKKLIHAAMGAAPPGVLSPVAVLPQGALLELTAAYKPGSPLATLLGGYGERAAQTIETELLEGIATGRGPREVARRIMQQVGTKERARLLTLARTETLRAHRSASLRVMQHNRHLVRAWVWHSALQPGRTCASCWAMHGSVHPLDQPMTEHPAGRCSMLPKTVSWRELGYDVPDERPVIEPGADIFARLSEEEQRATLGPAAFAAYQAGDIELRDLSVARRSAQWGTTRSQGSLAGALQRAKAREDRAA